VAPQEVGLPAGGGQRRTTGLRREEVAVLAGVSPEYYRRLEQGKQQHPGPAVLDAIAGVLRLTADERRHLAELADGAHALSPSSVEPATPPRPDVLRMLDIVHPYPACILGRSSDLLAANRAGLRLFPGIEDWPPATRNTARYTFTHPRARECYENWEDVAIGVVAHLRSLSGTAAEAPEVTAIIAELTDGSPEFARLWHRYEVRARTNGRKVYRHPAVGRLTLCFEAYDIARSGGQRLVVYQAEPGTPDHEAMLLLSLD
jgi:transcriptional regulator with XRE-family HTH domain